MHWTDTFHRLLIEISDLTNRFDVDGRLLAGAEVKLDRALFPLLSRLGLQPPMSTVELANLVGRDHSTVSRQIARLEHLGLVVRTASKDDGRVTLLTPSPAGRAILSQVARVRRQWIEDHFRHWSSADRETLVALMTRMMAGSPGGNDSLPGGKTPGGSRGSS